MSKPKGEIQIIEAIAGTTKFRVRGSTGNEYTTDYGLGTCDCDYKRFNKSKPCAHLKLVMAYIGGPDWTMPAEDTTPKAP